MLPWAFSSSLRDCPLLVTNRRARRPAVFPLVDFLHTHPKASYPVLQSFDRRGESPEPVKATAPLSRFHAARRRRSGGGAPDPGSVEPSAQILPGHDLCVNRLIPNGLQDYPRGAVAIALSSHRVARRFSPAADELEGQPTAGLSKPSSQRIHTRASELSTRHPQRCPQLRGRAYDTLRGGLYSGHARRLA
jgi:hypothetical protein